MADETGAETLSITAQYPSESTYKTPTNALQRTQREFLTENAQYHGRMPCAFVFWMNGLSLPSPQLGRELLWETFVSVSLLGMGAATLRLLGRPRFPLALAGCAGTAVWLLIGGWLNLYGAATRPVLICLLSVGLMLGAWTLLDRAMRSALLSGLQQLRQIGPVGALLITWFLLVFVAHLRPQIWNKYDDPQAYMAYATKAAQLGSLQSDPFSERRINTGLGGGIFLNVTMLAGAGVSAMGYIDGGFGYLIFVLAVWSLTRALQLQPRHRLLVMFLVPLLTLAKINLTVVYLSTAFFLAIVWLLLESQERELTKRDGLLAGLLLGAACVVKSSNIPFGGLLLILFAATIAMRTRNLRRLAPFLFAMLPLATVVLPWALKLHRDEGTFLFPSLGRGFHGSAYGLLPLPAQTSPVWQSLLLGIADFLFVLAATLLIARLSRTMPRTPRVALLSFFAASLLSIPPIAVSVAGESIDRFTLPFCVPCFLFLAMTVLCVHQQHTSTMMVPGAVGFLGLWLLLFAFVDGHEQHFYTDIASVKALVGHPALSDYEEELSPATLQAQTASLRRAQASIPVGETALEAVHAAYAFDWQRNPIYIADYPGMAGLPPGLPLLNGPEAVRQYLLHCGIHYLIYDRSLYKPEDFDGFLHQHQQLFPTRILLLHPRRWHNIAPWSRMEASVAQHTRELFQQLATTQPIVYDDGQIEVVQLTRAQTLRPGSRASSGNGSSVSETVSPAREN